MSLTDLHRVWIQTCASRSCIPQEEAMRMFAAIWHKEHKRKPTDADLAEVNGAINEQLRPMGQQIKLIRCDIQRSMFVVFSDTSDSAIHRAQTNISETERSLFHLLLKELATADTDNAIDLIAAINLTNQLPGQKVVSKQRAEDLLGIWTRQGYLAQLDNSRLHFGPRSVAEFGRFLVTNYPEHVHDCPLCLVAVFVPIRCADCEKPYHRECLKKYLAHNSKCPSCKRMWNVRLSQ